MTTITWTPCSESLPDYDEHPEIQKADAAIARADWQRGEHEH